MYIAHFLKKEVTGSPSEVCKLERKVFCPKFASLAGEIKKEIHPTGGSEAKVFFTSVSESYNENYSEIQRETDLSDYL